MNESLKVGAYVSKCSYHDNKTTKEHDTKNGKESFLVVFDPVQKRIGNLREILITNNQCLLKFVRKTNNNKVNNTKKIPLCKLQQEFQIE